VATFVKFRDGELQMEDASYLSAGF